MRKVAHIGPPRARLGGPAGYLDQLARAFEGQEGADAVLFPPAAPERPVAAASRTPAARIAHRSRELARRGRRALFGPPRQFRPALEELAVPGGPVDRTMRDLVAAAWAETDASRRAADADPDVDVLFAHDPFVAEALSDAERGAGRRREVWLMVHAPFPLALYHAWSFGLPEADWRDLARLPDVAAWTAREREAMSRVDRLFFPCSEAAGELVRVDPLFAEPLARAEYLLTGAGGAAPWPPDEAARRAARKRFGLPDAERVGLFLGNAQPYRGLEVLLAGLRLLPRRSELGGVLALAGPDPSALAPHDRLRPLGRVADVPALLSAVDFVVNVNRFSLFDLSTIEAAEAGKPLLLSPVGGNRKFRDLGVGCVVLDDVTPASAAEGLSAMFRLSATALAELGARSRASYESHLSARRFRERHGELYATNALASVVTA